MSVYHCQRINTNKCAIVKGENAADAVLNYDAFGHDQNDRDYGDGSINSYCEYLLTQFHVTELTHKDALYYIEKYLNGDDSIIVII